MAFEETLRTISREAASDLSTKQYFWAKIDTTGKMALAGDGDQAYPIQDEPKAGQSGELGFSGVSKAVAAASITAGDLVTSDAAGKTVTATSGKNINGTALTGAGADGELLSVFLHAAGAVVA